MDGCIIWLIVFVLLLFHLSIASLSFLPSYSCTCTLYTHCTQFDLSFYFSAKSALPSSTWPHRLFVSPYFISLHFTIIVHTHTRDVCIHTICTFKPLCPMYHSLWRFYTTEPLSKLSKCVCVCVLGGFWGSFNFNLKWDFSLSLSAQQNERNRKKSQLIYSISPWSLEWLISLSAFHVFNLQTSLTSHNRVTDKIS